MRCDRVALVQEGRILQIDAPAQIGSRYPLPLVDVAGPDRYRMLLALRNAPHAHSVYPFGTSLHFTDARAGHDPQHVIADIREYLSANGFTDVNLEPIDAGIEDSFMELMRPAQQAS